MAVKKTNTESVDVAATTVATTSKKNTEKVKNKPLMDDDEITVISLVNNISYRDDRTGDVLNWDKIGHKEIMTYEEIKYMWRKYKGYFREMWLKPDDDRVIDKLSLNKIYSKYDFLMDPSNYIIENIDEICESIRGIKDALKYTMCDKIKIMTVKGEISDARVLSKIDNILDLGLIDIISKQ